MRRYLLSPLGVGRNQPDRTCLGRASPSVDLNQNAADGPDERDLS
jgi:hypothetical protein